MRFATPHVPISSWPAWPWNESGGSPPSLRGFSTARAFTPEAPVTVELITWMPGYFLEYRSMSAFRAGPSSPAHQEKISSLSCARAGAVTKSEARAAARKNEPGRFMDPPCRWGEGWRLQGGESGRNLGGRRAASQRLQGLAV